MPLTVGQSVQNRYRVEALLAHGGMGAVYRAWDLTLRITVVIKENLLHSEDARRQFEREARILAGLRHPSLPRVTDYFFLPGQGQYLVMDYIEGEDLGQVLSRGSVPEPLALRWILHVLNALDYLHSRGIIHRDVKPANIKITSQNEVILVDFGLAKAQHPTYETTQGARGITPGYAPPEQYGQARTDARSDLYSLGATLYALLTGVVPPESLALTLSGDRLAPPRKIVPGVTARTEAAILRAMQLRPRDRFQSASEFRSALTRSTTVPKGRTSGSETGPLQSRSSLTIRLMGLTGIVLLVVLSGLALALLVSDSKNPAKTVTATVAPRPTTNSPGAAWTAEAAAAQTAQAATDQAGRSAATAQAMAYSLTAGAETSSAIAAAATRAENARRVQATETARAAIAATRQAQDRATEEAQRRAAAATEAAQATAAAQALVRDARVFAAQGWQASGVHVSRGDAVVVQYVSGLWTYWLGGKEPYDGEGPSGDYICSDYMDAAACGEPLPSYYSGALVGRVGTQLLPIGNYLEFVAENDGVLDLRINDPDGGLYDNDGSIVVRITVRRS